MKNIRLVKHIASEMEKPKPDSTHIKMLLSESFHIRREYIASLKPEDWGCILDTFPCFNHIDDVCTHVWNLLYKYAIQIYLILLLVGVIPRVSRESTRLALLMSVHSCCIHAFMAFFWLCQRTLIR